MNSIDIVNGKKDDHDIKVFTISTCAWCKKVKKLLRSMDVEFRYVDIDLLEGEEKNKVREELEEYNPKRSCPTMIIDGGDEVIIGFKEDKIKEVLEEEKEDEEIH